MRKLSDNGHAFLHNEEGLRLKAYQDSAGVWTIGYGSTYYEDGSKVKRGDTITKARAQQLFHLIVKRFEKAVSESVKSEIDQNQFDALVSIAYNIGVSAFRRSSLLRKVNANPCDKTIGKSFEAWRNAGGQPILLNRRKREADLYFKRP